MFEILKKLRPMRVALLTFAILTMVFKAKVGTPISYDGWTMIETVFIPVMAPIITMLLLLDSIISSIWITQTTGNEKKRYKLILGCNLLMVIIMLSIWIPHFINILL